MAINKKPVKSAVQKGAQRTPPALAAYVALLTTADAVKAFFETICAPFDITRSQYNVLRILRGAEPDGLPTLVIADRMIERTPGITRMIDRLENKGLVKRIIRAQDRRYVYCRITEKGLSLLQLMDEPARGANRDSFRGLSTAEVEQLTVLLLKMREALESE